jgi:MerR family copper efflux transcriptional regulator
MMQIGELARRSGIAATALRYYEKAGLLPQSSRTLSGYRDYDRQALPRLAFIRAAQAIGLSLAEIREVVGIRDRGAPPCAHVLELIERHRAEVRARIRQLEQLELDLAQLAEQGATVDPAECDPAGICNVIPTKDSAVSSPLLGRLSKQRVAASGPSSRRERWSRVDP